MRGGVCWSRLERPNRPAPAPSWAGSTRLSSAQLGSARLRSARVVGSEFESEPRLANLHSCKFPATRATRPVGVAVGSTFPSRSVNHRFICSSPNVGRGGVSQPGRTVLLGEVRTWVSAGLLSRGFHEPFSLMCRQITPPIKQSAVGPPSSAERAAAVSRPAHGPAAFSYGTQGTVRWRLLHRVY